MNYTVVTLKMRVGGQQACMCVTQMGVLKMRVAGQQACVCVMQVSVMTLKMRAKVRRAIQQHTETSIASLQADEDELLQGVEWGAVRKVLDLNMELRAFGGLSHSTLGMPWKGVMERYYIRSSYMSIVMTQSALNDCCS